MPVLFVDLDGTLVDRDEAVRLWAEEAVTARGLETAVVDAVLAADGGGHRDKSLVATDLIALLGLSTDESRTIIPDLRAGIVKHLTPAHGAVEGLVRARQAGWTIIIVTNGATHQQQAKIAKLGLLPLVDGCVISEACGVEKPDPAIFEQALATVPGATKHGAWHIGDSAEADIQGAHNFGIRSVFLPHRRPWPPSLTRPTAEAASFGQAVDLVLDSTDQPTKA